MNSENQNSKKEQSAIKKLIEDIANSIDSTNTDKERLERWEIGLSEFSYCLINRPIPSE